MFNKFEPKDAAYIIGLFQTDAHHEKQSRDRGKVRIELADKDSDILDKVKNVISRFYHVGVYKRTRKTNFSSNHSSTTLTIYRKEFRELILPYLPTGKKSEDIKPPQSLTEELVPAYLLGISDGDGSIGMTKQNRPFWSLTTASDDLKDFVVRYIKEVTGFEKRTNRNSRDGVYNLCIYDEDAVAFTKFLYEDAPMYLDRKYEEYLKIQKWVRTLPKRTGRPKAWLDYEDKVVLNTDLTLEEKMKLLNRTAKSIKTRHWRLTGKVC